MKKQTMYNRLQKQYAKLNLRIQKAMQTGRFYAYTQFKQEQLLNRLKRCSFQLKQLGAGVAVVAALGMATPVVGQTFIQRVGVDNPWDGINGLSPSFGDLDGDGDIDCFVGEFSSSLYNGFLSYYENTGDSTNAIYVAQTSANSPLNDGLGLRTASFVDIDGDGDLDCFAEAYYYNDNKTFYYYENVGTATSPSFMLQTTANNPLGIVLTTYGSGVGKGAHASFVDIDNDNDMDCFVGFSDNATSSEVLFYENTGTATNPLFVLQTGSNNPLSSINSRLASYGIARIEFKDMDKDGDKDAFVSAIFSSTTSGNYYFEYHENVGTAANANFVLGTSSTPLDLIPIVGNDYRVIRLLDIDNDTDLDVVAVGSSYDFWENQDTVVYNSLTKTKHENLESVIYPNPTSGNLNFEQAISGRVKIYTISGQSVLDIELYEEQYLNIEKLNNGIYFLEIQTEKGRIREKVILQK